MVGFISSVNFWDCSDRYYFDNYMYNSNNCMLRFDLILGLYKDYML